MGNGGTRLPVQEKNTNGVFETGDVINNLANFHLISDGSFNIEVDGEAAVTIPNFAIWLTNCRLVSFPMLNMLVIFSMSLILILLFG